jgi:hypothetical protein
MKATSSKKSRLASAGPKSDIAQKRRSLYAKTLKRVSEALTAGFVLEAITLLESVISDRLESRLAKLDLECKAPGRFWPLSAMAKTLAEESNDPDKAKEVYASIPGWAESRNKALHGLGKLAKADDKSWDEKYEEARVAAARGMELFRALDREVRKVNRDRASK